MSTVYAVIEDSPVGAVVVSGDGEAVTSIHLGPESAPPGGRRDDTALAAAVEQLRAYFEGSLHEFELALAPSGTPFQRAVWIVLATIPYGETTTYATVAARIGKPAASRAVGAAIGRNPIGIVIPCHRVVGADGRLTGYAGGLDNKRILLDLEAKVAGRRLA